MSKFLKVMIAAPVLIAVMTAPAMAELKLNGYYRIQGTGQNLSTNEADNDSTFVDQRLRLKLTNSFNENISVVYYGEYDAPFGQTGSKTVAGNGGKLSSDGVGFETKHFYVDFKVPNSSWSVRTGIQGFGFGKYESFVTDDDMAGISARGDVGPVKISAAWFKWDEGESDASDDADFYKVDGDMKVSDQLSLGLTAAAVINNNPDAVNIGTAALTDDFYYGVNANYTMDKLGFAGSLLFRKASGQDSSATDGDAMMLNLYATAKLNGGHVKVHGIFIPADDSANGTDRFSANQAGYELWQDNLMIFGTDGPYNNGSQGGAAVYDSAYAGYGLMGLTVSGDFELPEAAYLKYGAGYFMTADDNPGGGTVAAPDSVLGTEVAAQIGKVFAEKYDLSLRGAYGFMGDFYGSEPEDTYKVVAMLDVNF